MNKCVKLEISLRIVNNVLSTTFLNQRKLQFAYICVKNRHLKISKCETDISKILPWLQREKVNKIRSEMCRDLHGIHITRA